MRTTIVCGMLGSGKTTFIQNILRGSTEKTVVLVNDYGSAGIDAELLSIDGIEAIGLPSGCVCCTLKYDLITTIEKVIRSLNPDHIMIEPSGVALPSGVIEALHALRIAIAAVIGIVDATEFIDIYSSELYGSFFEDQIINSDLILVNKTDLSGADRASETVRLLGKINPLAIVLPTVMASFKGPLPGIKQRVRNGIGTGHGLPFETVTVSINKGIGFNFLRQLFEELQKGIHGDVMRAKALVQTDRGPFRFDLSFSNMDIMPLNKPIDEGRLVVIGEWLNRAIKCSPG